MAQTAAAFKVDYFQFLKPDGKLVEDQQVPALAKDFDRLTELYKLMVLTRSFDKKAVALQRTGKLGTYASSLGHEAAHVSIGAAMKEEDCFAPMYREYGAQFYRGVKMSEVLLYWGGDERGSDFSGPEHDFAWCVPIATQCLHAAGAAMAFKLKKEERVAVTVVGDGGSSKGDFLEAINAGSAWKLPLVLVIVNNQWAISVPRKKQNTAATLAQKGIAGGLPSIQVDGNDLIACLWAMDKAINAARRGKGAFVIEMLTYRLSDHTTADDARRYRPSDEVDEAWDKEPLSRLKTYLVEQGAWNEEQEEELLGECKQWVQQAADEYLEMIENDPQPVTAMFDYMFKELPHDLIEQRSYAQDYAEDGGQH
ncbi:MULTISPECIES: pyruvate dehydrogenase (acetyl-transferring) E1 component subunit alpha [unclassified Wenzhouxiangella]|uniref:pyruvate dehydrogenase (acetyl-transferring) E1 component subunit alpha n=1 Tax=unclassified Wenzhouxiangella TaxID=2613841 RepID=UPI000E32A522|nr:MULTISPECIES: pyruvate dehydrogenase (acetyl-transferring) E1 component subunit alpha [unclassified Wenzhouxiangella]RFF28691.1 pyruvate dehydrogenase (acetyl-transferring) E1 component subunit alpha [Wenzhouxiangella sp. 15181]RFP70252.1 pyruvate dehydrogenase (acetyl-transferring) E1 component subunit alpha [Wenzhouxiangella sp. 15190]